MRTQKRAARFLLILLIFQLLSGCIPNAAAPLSTEPPPISSVSPADLPPEETPPSQIASSGELSISFISVGQGDCTFIVLPNGETMLIDAGNHENANDIIQYIKSSGKDTLTHLVSSHPHSDHIGGMAKIVKSFDVENIYMPKAVHTTDTYENLLDTIEEKGMTIQTAKAGKMLFDYGDIKAEFISPSIDTYSNLNNYSAVIMLTYQNKRFLFMGDAEKEIESELLSSRYSIQADVLKIGHHGSNTSSTKKFLEAVRPSIAVISVGRNSYGHPTAEVIDRLNSLNIEVLRTDEKGTIVVTCDGENITLNYR